MLIQKLKKEEYPFNAGLFSAISKTNKNFNLLSDSFYIVTNKHLTVGIVSVRKNHKGHLIQVFRTPNICRLSHLALIEASVLVSREIEEPLEISYGLDLEHYLFKYKAIFNNLPYTFTDTSITVSGEILKALHTENITKRPFEFT